MWTLPHPIFVHPSDALNLMHALREATGYTGEQLALAAVEEGLIDATPPRNRSEAHRHQKIMESNPAYARVINKLERRPAFTEAAFGIGAK